MNTKLENAETFSINNALILARCCELAYKDYSDIKAILDTAGIQFEYFDRASSQALLINDDNDQQILVFRGTEPEHLEDWLADINVIRERTPFGYVHRGFYNAYKSIEMDIYNAIDREKPLWITGHSLGGGLATIGVVELAADMICGIYTFGSPRVGDKVFVENYDKITEGISFRVVHNNDIITRLPQRVLGYSHVGQIVYIDHDSKVLIGDEAYKGWELFKDRIKGRLEGFAHLSLFDGIDDHILNGYINAIEKEAI